MHSLIYLCNFLFFIHIIKIILDCDVVADAKQHKISLLPDSMTGIAVYFQNVTPSSLVSKLTRHVIAYPSVVFYQFAQKK